MVWVGPPKNPTEKKMNVQQMYTVLYVPTFCRSTDNCLQKNDTKTIKTVKAEQL